MKILIHRDTVDGYSEAFEVRKQATIYAAGLEPGDTVEFYMLLISSMEVAKCVCPPGQVQLPSVIDEMQLLCCGEPIVLTRENPYIIIDAPLRTKLRAHLTTSMPTTQVVWMEETDTANVNDRMRGCPCGEQAA